MCGFAGLLTGPSFDSDGLQATATQMAAALVHRGPDDGGVWCDREAGIALAHRRLAILDLSPAGHQPMSSACGRYILAFNGEIYNHLELRQQLTAAGQAPAWRGHSDTETLLAAIATWGLPNTLDRAVGMFALALWDRHQRTLQLARDRFGEKPLYYGWIGESFAFASELKALRTLPHFPSTIDSSALALYLQYSYVPAPYSIHPHIYKLEPGCRLELGADLPPAPSSPLQPGDRWGSLHLQRWYSLPSRIQKLQTDLFPDLNTAQAQLEQQLRQTLSQQAIADVPLGAFLSGGIDSSTVVALLQQQSSQPIRTFTIGFAEASFDESPHARAVAQHLGTDHHELTVTTAEAQAVIPQLPTTYDEPFADSSQIPTSLVCHMARQQLTVALSGDGGDELFGGYNRYFLGPRVWNRIAWLPQPLRRRLGSAIAKVSVNRWDRLGQALQLPIHRPGDKAHQLASCLRSVSNLDDLYRSLVTKWPDPDRLLRHLPQSRPIQLLESPPEELYLPEPEARMMLWDSLTYLPDDILCKVDRAAMATSLETRVPFLDHRVVELAWRMPLDWKIQDSQGKWPLRRILYQSVPPSLIDRPKAGFGIPVGDWLRGPLRDWAEDLLSEARLQRQGIFHSQPIRELWQQHLDGRDWTVRLWIILMFQSWYATWHSSQ
ncbi:asparagine synthase (glutamine-hydrolyzing) [Synechococcus elongatus]|uniref:asparagine synthase (glutamine-hydrolyzing) n=1 Tax=Synechococcus elongatus TaxID=32046 RepID=UPI0030CC1AB1